MFRAVFDHHAGLAGRTDQRRNAVRRAVNCGAFVGIVLGSVMTATPLAGAPRDHYDELRERSRAWGQPSTVAEGLQFAPLAAAQSETAADAEQAYGRFAGIGIARVSKADLKALRSVQADGHFHEVTGTTSICDDAGCVAEKLGGSRGATIYRIYRGHEYRLTPPKSGRAQFSDAQIETIAQTLQLVPENLVRLIDADGRRLVLEPNIGRFLSGNSALARHATVLGVSGPGVIGIRLSPAWAGLAPVSQKAVLLHEIGHDLSRRMWSANEGNRAAWVRAVHDDEFARHVRKERSASVSVYATTSLDEDFAESLTAFILAPDVLKYRAPNRYRLLAGLARNDVQDR